MIKLNNISRSFNKEIALHPFSYESGTGRTNVFIGPSGCGKSTLLRLINGLLEPDEGEIYFYDHLLTKANVDQMRHKMGYVIQEGGLFSHLCARDNVSLLASYLSWDAVRIRERVEELTELVKLSSQILSRYPADLSGGERQRVSLMRALMLDPDLLLMDEPLGALDPMIRFDLQQQLRDIFRQLNKTVFLVTHDMAEAAFFADKVVLLKEGRVQQEGSVDDFLQRPANSFVEQFIRAQRHELR